MGGMCDCYCVDDWSKLKFSFVDSCSILEIAPQGLPKPYLYQVLVSSSFLAIGVTVLYIQKPVLPILIGIRCYFSTNITYFTSIGNFLCFFFKQNRIYTRDLKIGLYYVIFILSHSFWGFPYKVKIKIEKYIETISMYMYTTHFQQFNLQVQQTFCCTIDIVSILLL